MSTGTHELLRIVELTKHFVTRSMFRGIETTTALADVTLNVPRGGAVGIVGESGSGKSTLVKCILGLEHPSSGEVWFDDQRVDGARRSAAHRGQIQPVFQNPVSSLNPRRRIGEIVADPLAVHTTMSRAQQRDEIVRLLELVGLPASFSTRYPGQLSGGQCQRVSIARALALKPKLIVADEATSALDVLVQEQTVRLLHRLRLELGMALLFVSHNLAVTRRLCDSVAVMKAGRIVEFGEATNLVANPQHDYTRTLVSSVPVLRRETSTRSRGAVKAP